MAFRRQFSDNDKAAALAALDANGGNVLKTAKQINVPRSTLQEWANGRVNHDVPELRQQAKKALAERLEEIAHQLIDAVPDKIADASLQQVATALGIVVDKKQLLTGEATSRADVRLTKVPPLPDDQLDAIFSG